MTWPELQAREVVAFRDGCAWQFEAPESVEPLVRQAVLERVPMMAAPPRAQVPHGRCDACGGGLGGRCTGGWCPPCGKARELALRDGLIARAA